MSSILKKPSFKSKSQIDEQIKITDAINLSSHYLQNLFMQSPVAICILKGNDFTVQLANDLYLQMVEKKNDFIGKPLFQSLPELESQGIRPVLDKVLQTGIPYYGNEEEVRLLRNSKKEQGFYNFVYQPLREQDHTISGIIVVVTEVTEQVLSRKKLEESEFRYANMIYNSPSLFAIFKGKNMIIEIANNAILESWGKGKNIIGKSLFDAIPETVEQGFDQLLLSVYDTGIPVNAYETPITLIRNGKSELVYYNFVYQAQKGLSGKIVGVAVIASEVTPQALFNKKIKASEEQFRLLVLQAPVAICVLRHNNYVIEVINERMLEMWDRTLEQVINEPAFNVLAELKEQGFKELLDDVYNKGERFVADELPITLKRNGKLENIYVKFIYEPLREADGTISGVMALAHDITEQVVIRKKMQIQADMVKELLLTAPAFICTLTGPLHIYDLVNERYQSLFGKRRIQGKPIMEALPELEGQGFDKLLDKVYHTGEPYVGIEIPITLARDENLVPQVNYFNFSYQPIYNEDKQVYSILVFGYEVTDQVIAKNKNIESYHLREKELEEKVQQRTIDLKNSNESLLQKIEELKNANKELESFTFVTGHDLQEPLRKIQTLIGRLVEKENKTLSDKGKDYFDRIQGEAIRMRTLINDLLAFSRIGTADLKFEDADLNSIVEEVKEEYKEAIEEKHAVINVKGICAVKVISFQFRQLMHNLISNALKFSNPKVPPYITIESHHIKYDKSNEANLPLHKEYCHISITDNGIGFEKQYSEKIFEVFQRLHGKEEYAGTGIGLAIVKKIVENHNGIITATGELNKGSTFHIYIPTH